MSSTLTSVSERQLHDVLSKLSAAEADRDAYKAVATSLAADLEVVKQQLEVAEDVLGLHPAFLAEYHGRVRAA